ncbi:slipin family protein, partial [Streptomyces sp. NPDC005281]
LRLLQTVVAVAAEKNSTLVLPFPVELLRFLERAQSGQQPPERPQQQRQQRVPDPRPPAVPERTPDPQQGPASDEPADPR